MSSSDSEEKRKRKQEKAERLRNRQEEALRKAHEQEKETEKQNVEAKLKEEIPEEMVSRGYKITKDELSSGQYSTIFKAKYKDEDIIVRIVEKEGKEDSFVKKLIPRFVRILRALDERHPNIISTLDVFETSKRVLIPMRLTPNGTLYEYLDKQTDLIDESQCRKWAQQLISALCYLHINGIVHRDLRTERILLDENNCLKVCGFTYSRLWMNVKNNAKDLSNTCVGTGPYCSPETLTGEKYDPRTADVWAFGVIVFYIWNKNYPFDYNMTHKLLAQHKSNEWKNRIRKESNDFIKEFFGKTFDINHNQRQTIVDLLKDKWIDSKISVVLDESLKALDENQNGKEGTPHKEKNEKSGVKSIIPKETDRNLKAKNDNLKGKDASHGSNDSSKAKEETKTEKNNLNDNKKDEKTHTITKRENDTNEDTDDSDDDTDLVTDDDDEDDNQKSEVKEEQSTQKQIKKNEVPKKRNEEKPTTVKTSPTSAKREASDDNVLRPDILDRLKKDFMSLIE